MEKIKNKIRKNSAYFLLGLLACFLLVPSVLAAYEKYAPGSTVTLGEFVYDDNFSPTSTLCTISIYSPVVPHNLIITDNMVTSTAGWYYYDFSSTSNEGIYPATMSCGSEAGGDLARLDKTFMIASTGATTVSSTEIAAAVWDSSTSSLNTSGSVGKQLVDNINATISGIAGSVWGAATRLLTGKGLNNGESLATESAVNTATTSINNKIDTAVTSVNTHTNAATSTIAASVWNVATSTLTSVGSIGNHLVTNLNATISGIAGSVWGATTRLLTGKGLNNGESLSTESHTNAATSTIAASVWSATTRLLTGKTLNDGQYLATESYVDSASSTIINQIPVAVWESGDRSLTDYATTSIASSVWNFSGGRSLTDFGSLVADIATAVWDSVTAPVRLLTGKGLNSGQSLATESYVNTASSTIMAEILENQTLIRGLNNISATDVWTIPLNRTLTDYSTSSIAGAVWGNTDRSLTNYATSSVASAVWQNSMRELTNYGNNLTADQVWLAATTTLANSGSIGKLLVDNLDAKISSRGTSLLTAADVWDAGTRTLTDYSSSSLALAVWASSTRELTNYGNNITAADVWKVLTSTLTTLGSIGEKVNNNLDTQVSTLANSSSQEAPWTVSMSNVDQLAVGEVYKAKVYVVNNNNLTNASSTPIITIRNNSDQAVANVSMDSSVNGVYTYSYTIPNLAEGLWEAEVVTTVEPGKVIKTNDYFVIIGSPPQVIVYDVTDKTTPEISANITITNEGNADYEYHYEWCVVSNVNNACGGNDDVFYGSASKRINVSKDWNTNLTATVPNAGNYYFKLMVYYGSAKSGASKYFTATAGITPSCGDGTCSSSENCTSCRADCGACLSGGGGGGGGGGISAPVLPVLQVSPGSVSLGTNQAGSVTASTNQGETLTVVIPSKSVSAPTTISIIPTSSGVSTASLANNLAMLGGTFFELKSSSGQNNFSQPLTLTFTYTDAQIVGLTEGSLKIYWYDTASGQWQPLATTVNASANVLTAQVDHFTVFAIFGQMSDQTKVCDGADFNHDKKVNSIDFSILLAFWKTAWPFKNACVDVNKDKQVNSVDFSILMYQWGTK